MLVAHYIAQLCMNLALTLVPDALMQGAGSCEPPGYIQRSAGRLANQWLATSLWQGEQP